MLKILMIEDDSEIAELLTNYLSQYNIELFNYQSPMLGVNALERDKYDLLILDLSLPGIDGLDVCKLVREKHDIPIIISTARSDITDRVLGLEVGADDYLPKPYDPRELVARIQSVLRRYNKQIEKTTSGIFRVDDDLIQIYKYGEPLDLTRGEYEILKLFIKRSGYVVSREYIADNIDSFHIESSDRSIDVIVSRIRSKIGDSSKRPKYIQSVRGVGYKFIG